MCIRDRLISTHDIAEIETIADGCLVLENGRLAEVFTMDDLHEQGEDLKTRLAAYRPEKDKENSCLLYTSRCV